MSTIIKRRNKRTYSPRLGYYLCVEPRSTRAFYKINNCVPFTKCDRCEKKGCLYKLILNLNQERESVKEIRDHPLFDQPSFSILQIDSIDCQKLSKKQLFDIIGSLVKYLDEDFQKMDQRIASWKNENCCEECQKPNCLMSLKRHLELCHGVVCDNCPEYKNQSIHGNRYKCNMCQDYDLCESCYQLKVQNHHPMTKFSTNHDEEPCIGWAQHQEVNDDFTIFYKDNPLVIFDNGSPNRIEYDHYTRTKNRHNFPLYFVPQDKSNDSHWNDAFQIWNNYLDFYSLKFHRVRITPRESPTARVLNKIKSQLTI